MDPITVALGLAQFAPQIVKWVTGSDKSAEVAGKVVEIAQSVTGAHTPAEALEALKQNAVAAAEFKKLVVATEAELDKAHLLDRQDARHRDIEFVKAGRYNWRGDILASLAVGGLIICVWLVARDATLPERAVNAIMFVAGVLASCARDVYGFEFGSSRSSQHKDDTIKNLSK